LLSSKRYQIDKVPFQSKLKIGKIFFTLLSIGYWYRFDNSCKGLQRTLT
jgi:hypothetical protein